MEVPQKTKNSWEFPGKQWLRLSTFTALAQVQSLVRELRSRKTCSAAKKTQNKQTKKIHAPSVHSSTIYNSQDMEAT